MSPIKRAEHFFGYNNVRTFSRLSWKNVQQKMFAIKTSLRPFLTVSEFAVGIGKSDKTKRRGFLRCRNSKKYDNKNTTGEIKCRNRASLSDFQQKYDKNFVVFFCRNSAREAARLIQTATRRETRTHSRHKNMGPLRPCVGSSSDTSLAPPQPGTSLAPQQRGIHARTRFAVRQHGAPHGVRER